jgi:hypothetical protein
MLFIRVFGPALLRQSEGDGYGALQCGMPDHHQRFLRIYRKRLKIRLVPRLRPRYHREHTE